MVELQHADDVVDAALIDRDARKGRVVDNALHLVERLLDVERQHVDAVGRDLLRLDLRELNGRLQQVAALLVDHTLVFHRFDQRDQLVLRDAGGLRFSAPQHGNAVDQPQHNRNQRRKQHHEQAQRQSHGPGKSVTVLLGENLGRDLAKEQDEQRADERGPGGARGLAHNGDGGKRCHRRGRHVDEVVADQNSAKRAVVVLGDIVGHARAKAPLLRRLFEPQAVGRGKGDFRP